MQHLQAFNEGFVGKLEEQSVSSQRAMDQPKESKIEKRFMLTMSPHIRRQGSVAKIMMLVLAALAPATIMSLYYFGLRALVHIVLAVGFSVAAEAVVQKLRKVPVSVNDFSAVLTGLLLAFNVPPGAPYWISAVGGVFAIVVVKQAFGGLGYNFMNPALAARAFLLAAWPVHMTTAWLAPRGNTSLSGILWSKVDGVTAATPLRVLKDLAATGALDRSALGEAIPSLLTGNVGGCIGETSAIALLMGGILLLVTRCIDFRIPLAYVGTVFMLTWFFNGSGDLFTREALLIPVFHIFAGGLMLGALFMATDMVTSPITPVGSWLFGLGCGCITVLIRLVGGYPEGVSYSILLMNVAAPLLDRIKNPRKYGEVKKKNDE